MTTPITLPLELSNRRLVLPFVTNIAAGARVTLVSNRITMHWKITKIEVQFGEDAYNNLQVSVYASGNTNAPTANEPPDNNLTSRFSPTSYVVGEGQNVILDLYYIPSYYEMYLKVHFYNTNAYAVDGVCYVTIESITLDEAARLTATQEIKIISTDPIDFWDELNNKSTALSYFMQDVFKGTPEPLRRYLIKEGIIEGTYNKETQRFGLKTSIPFNYIKTDMSDEDKAKEFPKWWKDIYTLMQEYIVTNTVGDIASIGIVDSVRDWTQYDQMIWRSLENAGKVSDMTFEKAWLKSLERTTNRVWLPERPTADQLINMVVKEKITLDDFRENMLDAGFNKDWSQKIWDAHFLAPDFTEVRQAIWREGITEDEIPAFLKRVDLDPYYNEQVWFKLLYQIPPYADLINMRVKEVIDQKTFEKSIQGHGFYDPWATRLWDAHFAPPTYLDFLTAMRRKQTVSVPRAEAEPYTHEFGKDPTRDIEVIKELSILADYDPRYWDFFKQRNYEDPTPRQARWGYESGALTEEEVYDITKRHGFRDEDAKWFTDFTLKFQERPLITRYINALMAAYLAEVITAEELKKRITAIPRREAIADWITKIADVQKEIKAAKPAIGKERLLSVAELKRMFTLDMINEADFRTRLQLLGYETTDIQLLIDLATKLKEEEETGTTKQALTTSELFNAFKWWQISREDLRTALMLRGLNMADADLLINSKVKQWVTKEAWSETEPA